MSKAPVVFGLVPPLITPLNKENRPDQNAMRRLLDHVMEGGASALFPLGTCGEGAWLTTKEYAHILTDIVKHVAGRVPVVAGVIEGSTRRALETVRAAEEAGADCISVTSPYYYSVDTQDQLNHFIRISEATTLRMIIYNIPSTTRNPIPLSTIEILAHLPNVIGVKDSSGDEAYFEGLLKLRSSIPGFKVLQGNERRAAESILAGADGTVAGLANLAPAEFAALVEAARAGKATEALALQQQMNNLWLIHEQGYWLKCLKYAASLLGFGTGAMCDATQELKAEAKKIIETLMVSYAKG